MDFLLLSLLWIRVSFVVFVACCCKTQHLLYRSNHHGAMMEGLSRQSRLFMSREVASARRRIIKQKSLSESFFSAKSISHSPNETGGRLYNSRRSKSPSPSFEQQQQQQQQQQGIGQCLKTNSLPEVHSELVSPYSGTINADRSPITFKKGKRSSYRKHPANNRRSTGVI